MDAPGRRRTRGPIHAVLACAARLGADGVSVIYTHAMKPPLVIAAIAFSTLAVSPDAGEPVDEAIVARIKTEAFQHSRVLDTLSELTDVYGARLRGSPGYAAAADWVKQRLIEWGFEKVTFEPGGFPGPGPAAPR